MKTEREIDTQREGKKRERERERGRRRRERARIDYLGLESFLKQRTEVEQSFGDAVTKFDDVLVPHL